jgi:hypothetical protein
MNPGFDFLWAQVVLDNNFSGESIFCYVVSVWIVKFKVEGFDVNGHLIAIFFFFLAS